uniref:Uncharacterized protein n=1 Tax=Arundo donax TaxID=35708 RepID=A0A0A9BKP8_ARUDO
MHRTTPWGRRGAQLAPTTAGLIGETRIGSAKP